MKTIHPGGTMRLFPRLVVISILYLIASAGTVAASESSEKTPEAKANDASAKATSAYNEGVRRIDHAKEIGLKGDSTYAYNYRATSDAKARREYEKAVTAFQKAITLNPQFKEAHNNLGYCFRKLGKLEESLAAYDRAIALDSNFAQAREYRGETYLSLGQLTKAQAELEFLKALKSPYADQLEHSIELFKLAEIDRAAHGDK
ncbi:MAG: tetratricopeptide repeat protein [candidate division Zixibacteria bacterium]|nr:tetratricopeptide repeat protein [candidate division Zixibacteria bacterium]